MKTNSIKSMSPGKYFEEDKQEGKMSERVESCEKEIKYLKLTLS